MDKPLKVTSCPIKAEPSGAVDGEGEGAVVGVGDGEGGGGPDELLAAKLVKCDVEHVMMLSDAMTPVVLHDCPNVVTPVVLHVCVTVSQ